MPQKQPVELSDNVPRTRAAERAAGRGEMLVRAIEKDLSVCWRGVVPVGGRVGRGPMSPATPCRVVR
jgi:hypothetical protein